MPVGDQLDYKNGSGKIILLGSEPFLGLGLWTVYNKEDK